MKKVIIILVLIGGISMFILKKNNKVKITDIKYLSFYYTQGNMMNSNVKYTLTYENDKYIAEIKPNFKSEEEIKKVTNYIKIPLQGSIDKYKKTTETYKNICKNNNNTSSTKIDTLLEEAVELVIEEGQASTSMLQRRFRLGYARSGRLIDEMERLGVIGPHQGAKSREILMTYEEWIKFKERF